MEKFKLLVAIEEVEKVMGFNNEHIRILRRTLDYVEALEKVSRENRTLREELAEVKY